MVCAAFLIGADRAEAVQIKLYASPAPNRLADASDWSDWVANMTTALRTGSTALGDPLTNPGAFYTVDELKEENITEVIVTPFLSWGGTAFPAAPFDGERGQRMYFPTVVESETGLNDIRISNLGNLNIYYLDTDESPAEQEIWPTPYGPGSLTYYALDRIGVKADGTVIDSGVGDQLVNKIVFRGLGMAWAPTGSGTEQELLDAMIADLGDSLHHMRATACYYSDPDPETEERETLACGEAWIPEPGSGLLFLAALALLPCFRRRRA